MPATQRRAPIGHPCPISNRVVRRLGLVRARICNCLEISPRPAHLSRGRIFGLLALRLTSLTMANKQPGYSCEPLGLQTPRGIFVSLASVSQQLFRGKPLADGTRKLGFRVTQCRIWIGTFFGIRVPSRYRPVSPSRPICLHLTGLGVTKHMSEPMQEAEVAAPHRITTSAGSLGCRLSSCEALGEPQNYPCGFAWLIHVRLISLSLGRDNGVDRGLSNLLS